MPSVLIAVVAVVANAVTSLVAAPAQPLTVASMDDDAVRSPATGDVHLPLEAYALIGDLETSALVSSDGSIGWLCLPRVDSPACFARLVGTSKNGYWRIGPDEPYSVTRRYWPETVAA